MTAQYEEANKLYNKSGSEEDKANMDLIGGYLDQVQELIDEIVSQTDLLDPADDINSDDEN